MQSILRFIFSGGMATLIHWVSMALLIQAGFSPTLSTALGATLGAVLNYVLQYHLTFRTGRAHREAFPRYLVAVALGWCVNLGLFAGLHGLGVDILYAQGLTSILVAVLNYWLYKTKVFHDATTGASPNA